MLHISAAIKKNHKQMIDTDEELLNVRDTVISVHETNAAAVPPVLRDVEKLKPEITVGRASAPDGRYLITSPIKVAGPVNQHVVGIKQIVGEV